MRRVRWSLARVSTESEYGRVIYPYCEEVARLIAFSGSLKSSNVLGNSVSDVHDFVEGSFRDIAAWGESYLVPQLEGSNPRAALPNLADLEREHEEAEKLEQEGGAAACAKVCVETRVEVRVDVRWGVRRTALKSARVELCVAARRTLRDRASNCVRPRVAPSRASNSTVRRKTKKKS